MLIIIGIYIAPIIVFGTLDLQQDAENLL